MVKENIVSQVNIELKPVKEAEKSTMPASSTTAVPTTPTKMLTTSTKAPSTINIQTSTTEQASISNKPLSTSQVEFKHHHYEDMVSILQNVTKKCPKITRLYSIGKSVGDRELYVIEMSDNPGVHEPGMLKSIYIIKLIFKKKCIF